ncbi:hypothetical protein HYW35_01945 [Candidatus Saccharibacteria bacterium]|nr:hypothetical protein [Candidatus Saccharibacteria bacterium]
MTRAPFQGVPQSDYRLLHPEKERGTAILGIRTDKHQAELYLYSVKGRTFHNDDKKKLGQLKWQAHLELSKTIHSQIKRLLNKSNVCWNDIQGIVCFKGPGSFTGLRIGLTVANALASANHIPIVARRGQGWIQEGIEDLLAGNPPAGGDKIAVPAYGSPPNITKPKK